MAKTFAHNLWMNATAGLLSLSVRSLALQAAEEDLHKIELAMIERKVRRKSGSQRIP